MRSLVKDALPFSILRSNAGWARLGRCHYHIPKILQKDPELPYIHRIPEKSPIENEETLVSVPVGSKISISLRIRQPPRQETNNPIIIFLKRGIPRTMREESYLKSLAIGANAIVVEIHYLVSAKNRYPLPIHTVLAGYDWARTNLVNSGSRFNLAQMMTAKPPKIGVCGELVGGGLATMLALTEGVGKPAEIGFPGISALAVGNPILDWTALTQTDRNAQNDLIDLGVSANNLLTTRQVYFPKPEMYFDPFASPLLFFRTPASEIPNDAPAPNEHELLKAGTEDENSLLQTVKKRRSARKYPPAGSDLILPWTKVEVGKECVLKDQGVDLVDMMRKSHRRSEAEWTAEGTNPVKREFEVMERGGLGLWDEKHALEIGQWFGEILRKP